MATLPPIRLTGADVLLDGALRAEAIAVAEGRFAEDQDTLREVDLSGYLLLPGLVDLHGTSFERHVAPRPMSVLPFDVGLRATERDAAANGVTTAWLAQFWSWEGGLLGPDFAEALMAGLEAWRPRALIDMRLQLRLETHMVSTRDRLLAAIERHAIDYVVFNNHLPEAARMSPSDLEARAARAGVAVETMSKRLAEARAEAPAVPRHLLTLVKAFDALGVRYGSHDDPDADTREHFRILGAHIAEFPTVMTAACAAKAMGDPVVTGAPNVVRGGAQAGALSASALIARKRCDALVSDDHYPSLAQAAWHLADNGILSFAEAWAMISTAPARILRLADRGRIAPGLRADFVAINRDTREIEATVSAGRIAHLSGALAARMIRGGARLDLAAE